MSGGCCLVAGVSRLMVGVCCALCVVCCWLCIACCGRVLPVVRCSMVAG